MKRLLTLAAIGGMTFLGGISATAQDVFGGLKPLLQKVTVNGDVFYEAGKVTGKTIEVSADKPVDIEYTVINKGDSPSLKAGRVFVHFCDEKAKILVGGDYVPKKPSTEWAKDVPAIDLRKVSFSKAKGMTLTFFVGIYFPEAKGARIAMANSDMVGGNRVMVGKITVK